MGTCKALADDDLNRDSPALPHDAIYALVRIVVNKHGRHFAKFMGMVLSNIDLMNCLIMC